MIRRTVQKFEELIRELEMEGWNDDLINDVIKLKRTYILERGKHYNG